MDGAALAPMLGTDRAWAAATYTTLRALINTHDECCVEQILTDEITKAKFSLGYPPPLRTLFWSLMGSVSKPAKSDRLTVCFEAFQTINHFAFQTLQCHRTFRQILEADGLTAARIPTEIWLLWRNSGDSPSDVAFTWLDQKHRDAGLGTLF